MTMGAGRPSPEALARLAGPPTEPLRPPPIDDHPAVGRWRAEIHRGWLDGDPTAEACGHAEAEIAGVRCLRAAGPSESDVTIVYLHGGGYALGSPEVALPITERLAEHVDVISVDYRLAPEHPYPAAVDDAERVCSAVGSRGRRLVIGGDSAGANLAVSVARRLVAGGSAAAVPDGLVLLSPHLTNEPGVFAGVPRPADPRSDVDETTAAWLAAAYCGSRPPGGPEVSPLNAELGGLPPTLIQVGTVDSTLDHAARFARLARARGVAVTLDVWSGLWHTWHYHRDLPEARAAIGEAGRFAASVAS